jgi:imidazolonepropionase-like amidohydrolase
MTIKSFHAQTIYTGRSIVHDAYLVIDDKTITGISQKAEGVLAGKYPVITPPLVDAHSHIGMVRSGEPRAEAESNDHQDPIMALSDALDSVQMDDAAFKDSIEMGVLYSCVMPGSGNIIGGKTAVIRNYATNSTDAFICRAGLKAAFGYNPMSTVKWNGTRPSTRMGAFAILRKRMDEIRQKKEKYRKAKNQKKDEITFSTEDTVLLQVLDKRIPFRAHVHKIDDIAALLRLVDEYKINITVEHAMDVHRPEIFVELKKRNIPVIYGPLDSFAFKVELKHETWRNIRCLIDSGVHFGLMSDHPVTPSRQLFLTTRWFLRAGYSEQQVIELVSRKNAEILGIQKWVGTLEQGKWASFICWGGSPFYLGSYPVAVYGEGKIRYSE